MSNFVQVTPFMHVPDIDAAVAFFGNLVAFGQAIRRSESA